jgi:hypothetical protein
MAFPFPYALIGFLDWIIGVICEKCELQQNKVVADRLALFFTGRNKGI